MDDAQLRAYFDSAPDATLLVDGRGVVREANASVERVFGHRVADLVGRPVAVLVAPHLHERLAQLVAEERAAARRLDARDLAAVHADGHEFPVDVSVTPVPGGDGVPWLVAAIRDVSERTRLRGRAEIAAAQLRAFFDSAPDAMVVVDADGIVRFANPRVTEVLGYDVDEVVGRPVEILVPEQFREGHPELRSRYVHSPSPRALGSIELAARRKDGVELAVDISLGPVPMPDGTSWTFASIRDVTEKRAVARELEEAQAKYRFLADHDALTGLPNRRRLEREMAAHVDLCRANGPRGALLSLDVDHFKSVNDRLGHPVGDRLIVAVGESVRAAVRPRDLVARQGGDEFLVLLRSGSLVDARVVAERVVAAVHEAGAFLEPHGLAVTGSVGVAAFEQFPAEGISVDLAMIRADEALYAAKAAGRNRVAAFGE